MGIFGRWDLAYFLHLLFNLNFTISCCSQQELTAFLH